MFGVNFCGGPYFAQAFALEGEIVLVITRPQVLELFGVSMGPLALVANSAGELRIVATDGRPVYLTAVE